MDIGHKQNGDDGDNDDRKLPAKVNNNDNTSAFPTTPANNGKRKVPTMNPYSKKPRIASVDGFTREKLETLLAMFSLNRKRRQCMSCYVLGNMSTCFDKDSHKKVANNAEIYRHAMNRRRVVEKLQLNNVACFAPGCYVPVGICHSPVYKKEKNYWFVDRDNIICQHPDILLDVVYTLKIIYGSAATNYFKDLVGDDDFDMLSKVYKHEGTDYLLLHRVVVELYEKSVGIINVD
jgi:hypothetical protein